MDDGFGGQGSWSVEGAVGALNSDSLAARVDVERPQLGLRDVRARELNVAGSLFCVAREAETTPGQLPAKDRERTWPLAVAESYVRGADLVVSYQPSPEWPYSPQIYWRANALDHLDGLLGSLSLLVSVQTHLLDTWPRIAVTSQMAADEVLQVTADDEKTVDAKSVTGECSIRPTTGVCCVLRRLAGTPVSYAEFMPASDFRDVQVLWDHRPSSHVQWELFAEFLEKGVIRRARLHSAFLQRENDLELAAAYCTAIERDSLPLTT
jgi:hypothetical protein